MVLKLPENSFPCSVFEIQHRRSCPENVNQVLKRIDCVSAHSSEAWAGVPCPCHWTCFGVTTPISPDGSDARVSVVCFRVQMMKGSDFVEEVEDADRVLIRRCNKTTRKLYFVVLEYSLLIPSL